MADILLDNQAPPTTPASGKSVLWVPSDVKKGPIQTDDAGHHYGLLSRNFLTAASQALSSGDTYLTNSGLLIPSFGMQAGQRYTWKVGVSKTAAGTAGAILVVRIGSAQTTSDTSRLSLTQVTAQAAVADSGIMEVMVVPTVVNASTGVIAGVFGFNSGAVGFKSGKDAQSSTFDNTSTIGGQYIGLSLNVGASGAWTITSLHAELYG